MARALAILASLTLLLTTARVAKAGGKRRQHVVQPGDTLHDLARQFGCTVAELRKGNELGEILPVGKILQLRPPCGQRAGEARLDPRARRTAEPAGTPGRSRRTATSRGTKISPQVAELRRHAEPAGARTPRPAKLRPQASATAKAMAQVVAPLVEELPQAPIVSPSQLEAQEPPEPMVGEPAEPAEPAERAVAAAPADAGRDVRDAEETPPAEATEHVVLDQRALAALSPSVSEPAAGQSLGLPWRGRLQAASRLQVGEGYLVRRPHRAFGTETTIAHVQNALAAVRRSFPELHDIAIGDLSAEHGGPISDHRSHQSGRDIDIGLLFTTKPAGYPASFVVGTEETLHAAANWALLSALADTSALDGGASMIFLDYEVQGVLYRWAQAEGIDAEVLEKVFQYPRGKRASVGLVRHAANHADHFHVRFACASAEAECRERAQ